MFNILNKCSNCSSRTMLWYLGKYVGGRDEIDFLGFLTWKWWNIVIVLSFDKEPEIVYFPNVLLLLPSTL